MNNGLLVCKASSTSKNIGDFIQSVAQEIFLDHVDVIVEREHLNTFQSEEKTNVIMNGWFMFHPENFPPSKSINPLFVSFHLVPSKAQKFFSKKTIDYLKEYEPIGARDENTVLLMREHGIDSYFTGCLTLCLGQKFKKQCNDGCIFVDPYYELAGTKISLYNPINYIRSFCHLIRNSAKALKFYKKFQTERKTIFGKISPAFERFYCATNFYEYYKSVFSDEIIFNAEYITHQFTIKEDTSNEKLLNQARVLIQKYANASLVVTSRIHCGLPCLGVETPCIFVSSEVLEGDKLRSQGRFGGLIDLFHVLKWTPKGLVGQTKEMKQVISKGKINRQTIITARKEYKRLCDSLSRAVNSFLERNQ